MDTTLVLFEDEGFADLMPLVHWRTVFELLVGRKILLDRTAQRLQLPVGGVWTRPRMAEVAAQRCGAPVNKRATNGTVLVNGRWIFNERVSFPKPPCVGMVDADIAYVVCDAALADHLTSVDMLDPARRTAALASCPREAAPGRVLRYPWDVTGSLCDLLSDDWCDADATIESQLHERVLVEGEAGLHIGESTRVHPTAVLDASEGPIYISHDVEIGAQAVIEGPAYIGAGTCVRPHAWLHGGNAIGPVCRIGGEVDGCVIQGYTNKQHAGFLGHAYVGSWVNIGAGATNSDLKNTYGNVRVPIRGKAVDTGQQFFGCVIGDHAKIGINAAIPTGAVIGLSASIAATGLPPKFIPPFSWVTEKGAKRGDPLRLLDAACAAMARRNVEMTDEEVELFLALGERSAEFE